MDRDLDVDSIKSSRSTLSVWNLHHKSMRVQNGGFCFGSSQGSFACCLLWVPLEHEPHSLVSMLGPLMFGTSHV